MSNDFVIRDGGLIKYCGEEECVIVPDGVKAVSSGAFQKSPKKLILPESVEFIQPFCFDDRGVNLADENGFCIAGKFLINYVGSADSVVVPDGVEVIMSAFYNQQFSSVIIPESVKEINGSFNNCSNLKKVILPKVKHIGLTSFSHCTALEEVDFGNSLVEIGGGAFSGCSSLDSIVLPDTVECIGYDAFENCESLKTVQFNNELKEIKGGAFKGCSMLETITIPDSVDSIGENTFEHCERLRMERIHLPEHLYKDNPSISGYLGIPDENGCIVIGGNLVNYVRNTDYAIISEGVTRIEENAFGYLNRPKKVHLPNTIRNVEGYALAQMEVEVDPSAFLTTEKLIKEFAPALSQDAVGIAYVTLFQSGKRWAEAVERCIKLTDQNEVARNISMVLRKHSDLSTDTVAGRAVSFFAAHRNAIDNSSVEDLSATLQLNSKKWKKSLKAFENEFGKLDDISNDKLITDEANENASTGSSEKGKSLEEYVKAHYADKQIYPESVSAIKAGIHYSDSTEDTCSTQVLILLVNEYVDEFYNVSHEVEGTISVRRDIDNRKDLYTSEIADTIAKGLNSAELNAVLKKLAFGRDYRKFVIAYARYANEEEIKEYCIEINKKKRGKSKDKYQAANMMSALYISDTAAAFEYIEKNGDIKKYANMRGMTPDECRNVFLVPDFGMDEKGVHLIESDNGVYSAFVDSKLTLALVDSDGKCEKSMPKKAGDKAQSEYAELKKAADSFIKSRRTDITKMYLRNEAVDHDVWMKSYATHPILKRIGQAVIWRDENGTTFMIDDVMKTVDGAAYIPCGAIKPAHVLDMSLDDVVKWQDYLYKHEKSLIIDQVWEPIISYDKAKIDRRYAGVEFTNAERAKLRAALKRKGVDVKADINEGEFDHRQYTYEFSDTNKMNFGSSMVITYHIDEKSKNITLGSDLMIKLFASKYEINTILFEMDRAVLKSRIEKDEPEYFKKEILDSFSVAQILEFIDYSQKIGSFNSSIVLQNYKNDKYPDYDAFSEFVLE